MKTQYSQKITFLKRQLKEKLINIEDVQRKFNIRKIAFPEGKNPTCGIHNVFKDRIQAFALR